MAKKYSGDRVYAYAWRHHDDPATVPSVARQHELIADWAERRGLRLTGRMHDAPLPERPEAITRGGLGRLLSDIEGSARPALVLVVERASYRLGPTPDTLAEIRALGTPIGLVPCLPAEPAATTAPAPTEDVPVAVSNVPRVGIAPDARRELTRRLAAARQAKVLKGSPGAGPAPFGYRRTDRENLLVPHPEEAEQVRFIFAEYLRLRSVVKLIDAMRSRGYVRTRGGSEWSRAAVSWILKNRAYVGFVRCGLARARGKHQPLVSMIVFNRVGVILRANADKIRQRRERAKNKTLISA